MTDYEIMHFVLGSVMTNCYVVINRDTRDCVVIDPGGSGAAIADRIKEAGYKPVAILTTHGHFDHWDGVAALKASFDYDIPSYIHEADRDTLSDSMLNVSTVFGVGNRTYKADRFLKDDEVLQLAGFEIRVIFTPGHTRGGCCYYFPDEGLLFSGDTLFCQSVGRTDMPGGSMSQLVASVRDKLFVLPDDTKVFPGHNETTTIGFEKENNYYV